MTRIKIKSNPYIKLIEYSRWLETQQEWLPIDQTNNPQSKLLSDDFRTGFFPFQAEKIVKTIVLEKVRLFMS